MPDWYYGASSRGNCKHTWIIHEIGHVRWYGAHENGGGGGWDTHQIIPQSVPKIHLNRKRKICPIHWVKKALYGTLQAALQFWRNLTSSLEEWGIEINPYNWWVAKKKVSGKQLTLVWHVEDFRISHIESGASEEMIIQLSKRYRKYADLTIQIGKVYEYLIIQLDRQTQVKVKMDMMEYLSKIL